MTHQVHEKIKDDRLQRIQAVLQEQTERFAQALVGQTLPVLIEKPGRHEGQVIGRSPYLQPVFLQGGADDIGSLIEVRIASVRPHSLEGVRLGCPS